MIYLNFSFYLHWPGQVKHFVNYLMRHRNFGHFSTFYYNIILYIHRKLPPHAPGQTALYLAASQGYSSCCEALLSQGSNVMVADNVTKAAPLHVAGKSVNKNSQ